jgi:hypothetical protein
MQKKRAWFHASSMTMDHGGGRFQDSNSWCESCASSKLGTLGLLLVVQVQTRYGWHHSVVRRLCACAVCRSYIQQPTTRLFLGLDKHRRKLGQLINNSTCIRTRQRKLLRRPGPRMMNAADRSNARARGQSRCVTIERAVRTVSWNDRWGKEDGAATTRRIVFEARSRSWRSRSDGRLQLDTGAKGGDFQCAVAAMFETSLPGEATNHRESSAQCWRVQVHESVLVRKHGCSTKVLVSELLFSWSISCPYVHMGGKRTALAVFYSQLLCCARSSSRLWEYRNTLLCILLVTFKWINSTFQILIYIQTYFSV